MALSGWPGEHWARTFFRVPEMDVILLKYSSSASQNVLLAGGSTARTRARTELTIPHSPQSSGGVQPDLGQRKPQRNRENWVHDKRAGGSDTNLLTAHRCGRRLC